MRYENSSMRPPSFKKSGKFVFKSAAYDHKVKGKMRESTFPNKVKKKCISNGI